MEIIFLLVAGIAVLTYVTSRRQKKETQATQDLQDSLEVGDEVMTTSGLHGVITDLDEDTIDLEVSPDVVTTWNRMAIRQKVVEPDADVTGASDSASDIDVTDDLASDDDTTDGGSDESVGHQNGASPAVTSPRLTND